MSADTAISSAPHLSPIPADFSDWLSPMVVKEIRQGLRGWLFLTLFGLLHLCLLFWCFTQLESGNSSDADALFWFLFTAGLLGIALRGLNALHSERRDRTLELLQLTRLTAWRILCGKWCAVLVQMLLFLASMLPYGVLRYYFGGFDAEKNLKAFLFLSATALFFSALTAALSCLCRWIAWCVTGGALWLIAVVFLEGDFTDAPLSFSWGYLALALLHIPALLALGTTSFGSGEASLAPLKRLLGWLIMLPAVAVYFFEKDEVSFVLLFLAIPLLLLLVGDALTAPSATTSHPLRNFLRWRWLGKMLAWIFAPNRAAGLLWIFLTGGLFFAGMIGLNPQTTSADPDFAKEMLFFVTCCGLTVLIPAGLAYLGQRKWPQHFQTRFWIYFTLYFIIGLGLLIICESNVLEKSTEAIVRAVNTFTPIGTFYQYAEDSGKNFPLLPCILQWLLAFGLLALPTWREARLLHHLLRAPQRKNLP